MAIITIGSNIGAGKTVLGDALAKALGYEEFYVGGIMREMARERGMNIDDFYADLREDSALEKKVDGRQRELMRTKDDLVVQGRVAWFFAKESPSTVFNIFLAVSPEAGAKRSAGKQEYAGWPLDRVARAVAQREKNELERYRALYGIENFLDHGHYDFVLDTTHLSKEESLAKVILKIKERLDADV